MNQRLQKIFNELEKERLHSNDIDSHILIIDGLNTFIRVFSATPALNDDGDHIGGVTGFLRSVALLIRQIKPTRCVIVFDGVGGSTRRRQIYPNYKANRVNKTSFNRNYEFATIEDEQKSMRLQFKRLVQYLDCLPITILSIDNIEADDAIAYIANEIYTKQENKVTICSTDRDFLQLVNNRISVWSPVKKKLYTPDLIKEEYGICSENFLLYRMFIGDASDNIPGVSGVGLKSLLKHVSIFSKDTLLTLDEILQFVTTADKNYKIYKTIQDSKDILLLNYKLMQLKEVDINGNAKMLILDKMRSGIHKQNTYEFKKMFMSDKMYTNIKDLDSWLRESFSVLNSFAITQ